jgi:polyisoprenyl-phosphate glycosyltransferase
VAVRTLTVVCPVYNEAEVLELFYAALKRTLDQLADRYDTSILFVVDRSEDDSLDILRRLAASDESVRVLAMSARFGHQMALVAGMDHSDSDAVILMDADLQHPPEVIPRLVERFQEGYDVVWTVRRDRSSRRVKRTASRWFYRFINWVGDVHIHESSADFRLVSRRVVDVFRTQIRERNQFLRGLFAWVGFPSIGVPFDVGARPAGASKYSLARMVRFAFDGIVSFSKSPLQAAMYTGFLLGSLGFAFAIVIVAEFFASGDFPPGWATLAILITVFSGVQLFFLGVVGAYIGAIFDEVKARPHYVIQEAINMPWPNTRNRETSFVHDSRLA